MDNTSEKITRALLVCREGRNKKTGVHEQTWSMYFGGEDEANGEKRIYDKDGYTEILRFWVEEKTCWKII